MSILLKPIYRFKAIPIKITIGFLTEIDKISLNLWRNEKDMG